MKNKVYTPPVFAAIDLSKGNSAEDMRPNDGDEVLAMNENGDFFRAVFEEDSEEYIPKNQGMHRFPISVMTWWEIRK